MEKTATVQIGEFALTLLPLKKEQVPATRELCERLIATAGQSAWADVQEALRLVYSAAQEPRPVYAELIGQATIPEVREALDVLGALTLAAYVPEN